MRISKEEKLRREERARKEARVRRFANFCNDMMRAGYRAYIGEDGMPADGVHYRNIYAAGIEVVSYENVVFIRDIYKKK